MTSSRSLLLLAALLATPLALTQARAAPLDVETCNKLMIEQDGLENAGVEQSIAKGPEWAKANLTPEKIDQVRRFIELDELILFRCRSKQRVTLPPDPEDKEPDQDKDKGKDHAEDSKGQAKDPQTKSGEANETVVAKTPPAKSEPKAEPKKQKAQPAKKPASEHTKAQPKTAPKKQEKQDTPGAKPQAKALTQPAPKALPKAPAKTGAAASQKPPPKAKVEDEPKAEASEANP